MKLKEETAVNIGIEDGKRRQIADGLSRLLADTYTLYLKTQNFHWNVTGPQFQALHKMFEEQYTMLAEANDTIAERIRALGFLAPATYKEFGQLSEIEEETGDISSDQMIRSLVRANETVTRTAHEIFHTAEGANDQATADLLTERMEYHEKTAWMLRSLLG